MSTLPATAEALDFNVSDLRLTALHETDRDVTRYVACLGNHLEAIDRKALNGIGGWAGGIWCGHAEIDGCPTMRRTHHMILRGLFTPLETTVTSKKSDHKELEPHKESYLDGRNIPPGTRGYTVYAGDDLNFLQSDRYRPMGVVELTSLKGVDWNSELRVSLQTFFFPEWAMWQKGQGDMPVLLSDWVDLVKKAQRNAKFQSHELIAEELLESARLFRVYATNHIEKYRQIIAQMRSTNNGGQLIGWHNKCRAYAEQLGIVLEDEKGIAPAQSGDMSAIAAEMREDRKLRQQELLLLAKKLGVELDTPPVQEEVVIDEVSIAESSVELGVTEIQVEAAPYDISETQQLDLSPQIETPEVTPGCPEVNGKGEPCKGKVKQGHLKCIFHESKDNG